MASMLNQQIPAFHIPYQPDPERLKRKVIEQLRRWEETKEKRPKMILFCNDAGILQDVKIEISIKNQ